ncbi:MAG: phage tail protein [Chloroflexi bacterium]|nr:phage tail protein [Chloroflexota bacterium]MCH9039154.1 phage tail protein [Chloroflexota bacterium]
MTTENPLIASRFKLDVQGITGGHFTSCSGFANTSEVITHQAVGDEGAPMNQKLPGGLTWSEITLERGLTGDMSLWVWRQLVIDGLVNDARRDGSIVMLDTQSVEIARWNFTQGWPSAWNGPDVGADNQAVAIESITIAHEGLERAL